MMDSIHYREESPNTFFPSLLAFLRFSIWTIFNALFVIFVGHDSAFMDKFPSFHVEVDQDETVTKPSIPIIETQYGGAEDCHQEILTQEVVMYTEEASSIDAVVLQAPEPEKKKNTRRKKATKIPNTEVTQRVAKEQQLPSDEEEWTVVASKKSSVPSKLQKDKNPKPKEQKKAESKKNTPKKEAQPTQPQQQKPKVQKEQTSKPKPSKAEAPVLPQPAPIMHSMLKRNYLLPVEAPLVKPVRQPIGPPTTGGFGFSAEYRKSRMSAVVAH